jgi:hypothetical protein
MPIVILACQKSDKAVSVMPPTSQLNQPLYTTTVPRAQNDQLKELLQTNSVRCEGPCPEAVGNVVGWAPDPQNENLVTEELCTGFLVAPDVVATNSHCIPQAVIDRPELCSERLGFKLPSVKDKPAEILTCARLIQASFVPTRDPDHRLNGFNFVDFAFFKVDKKSERHPLSIARHGVADNARLVLYSADPVQATSSEPSARANTIIRRKECVTRQMTVMSREYQHDFSNVVFGYGPKCSMVHGNSGSPAFDENGSVAAIFFAFDEGQETIKNYSQQAGALVPHFNPDWNHNGYFINYACLDLPKELGLAAPAVQCSNLSELERVATQKQMAMQFGAANSQIDREKAEVLGQQPNVFFHRFDILTNQQSSVTPYALMRFTLQCLLPKEYWPSLSPAPDVSGHTLNVRYFEKAVGLHLTVDEAGVGRFVKQSDQNQQVEIAVDLDKVKASDEVVGSRTFNGVKSAFRTHWCSKAELSQNSKK